MAQQKTVHLVGGALIVGALTFVSAVPAQAVDSEPSPASAQTEAPSSASAVPAQAVNSEPSPASTQTEAPSSASAQAEAKPAKPTKRSKPKKRSDQEKTIKMVALGLVKLVGGDHGSAVQRVQAKLTRVGILTTATGFFDNKTAKNVGIFNEKFLRYDYGENQVITKRSWLKLRKESKTKIPRYCLKQKKVMCISKKQKVLRYLHKGRVKMALDVRFGVPGYRTRNGKFKIFRKKRNDYSVLYRSVMKFSMYFSGGQAVHWSKSFPIDGYWGGSRGCVNTRNYKLTKQLFKKVTIGTPTFIY